MTFFADSSVKEGNVGRGRDLWMLGLDSVAGAAVLVAIYMALVWVPDAANLTTPTERAAQHIFYLHMGMNIGAGLGYLGAFLVSILYLLTGRRIWDMIAVAAVELGVAFGAGVLATGSIWAKPTWNTWWTWEPRLTTAAIGWLMYVGYLMLRSAIDHPERRARFSAVFSIIAFLSVPITFLAIRWWRTIHPVVIGGSSDFGSGGFALGPTISLVFFYCLFAFTVLYIALLILRARSEWLVRRVQQLRQDTLYRYRS